MSASIGSLGPQVPGNPGKPKGAAPRPAAFKAGRAGTAPSVGEAFGVDCFSSTDFLTLGGAGVDDDDDVPLLGLTGSFFAWLFASPFSLEGLRRDPF